MRPVSGRFLDTLRGSHSVSTTLTVCETYQTGNAPAGTTIGLIDGDIRWDADATIRGVLTLTTDASWGPLLAPVGNEIHVARTLHYGNGSETLGLGFYRIVSMDQDDADDDVLKIVAHDRTGNLVRGRLRRPRQYPAATTVDAMLTDLLTEVYPDATLEYDDDTTGAQPIGRDTIVERDRWEAMGKVVAAWGKIIEVDHRGVFVVRAVPDPTTPVWAVDAGANGVLVKASRGLSIEGVYNAWVVTGEGVAGDQAPAYGEALDLDPNSLTYYYGPFGPVPGFYSSQFITSDDQATAVAEARLTQRRGVPYSVNFQSIPNPALVYFDPIAVRSGAMNQVHIIKALTLPLPEDGPPMSASTALASVLRIGA